MHRVGSRQEARFGRGGVVCDLIWLLANSRGGLLGDMAYSGRGPSLIQSLAQRTCPGPAPMGKQPALTRATADVTNGVYHRALGRAYTHVYAPSQASACSIDSEF